MASSIIHYAITCELIKRRQFNNPDRLKLGSVLVDSGYNGNSHMKISVAEGQKKTYDLGGYREIYGELMKKDCLHTKKRLEHRKQLIAGWMLDMKCQ